MYHKDFILDQIIVSYKSQLEDGSLPKMKFHFLDNEVPVCGGLYAIKGDHMEKTQMAGIVDQEEMYQRSTQKQTKKILAM
jgi:hypothetical protein